MKKIFMILMISLLLLGCQKVNNDRDNTQENIHDDFQVSTMFTDRDKETGYNEDEAISLYLDHQSIICDSSFVEVDGSCATILEEGTYVISGELDDGSIIVDADNNDKIHMILQDVNIQCTSSAAIYIKQADKVFITLASDSINTLSHTGEYIAVDENNVDGVIYSKDDLTINGTGTLNIEASYGHGIVSKDDLVITGGTYHICSDKQGLSGKESVRILTGSFEITSSTDAIHSENEDDESLGFIYIVDGEFTLESQTDCISSSSILQIDDGTFDLISGEGSQNASMQSNGQWNSKWGQWGQETSSDTASAKGIKANDQLICYGGSFMIDSSDDALHSNNEIIIEDGVFTILSGDDGIHTDSSVVICGGTIDIEKSYEGIEAQNINISQGNITLISLDDGLNAAGGNDQSSTNERPGAGRFDNQEDAYIEISGGILYINVSGDGIDSNGNILMSGGEVYIFGPENSGNASLDYGGEAKITGGIFMAVGSGGMALNFSESSTQGSILINVSNCQDIVILKDSREQILLEMTPSVKYSCVIISCPQIEIGKTYTLQIGNNTQTIEMTSLIYGNGQQSGNNMSRQPYRNEPMKKP